MQMAVVILPVLAIPAKRLAVSLHNNNMLHFERVYLLIAFARCGTTGMVKLGGMTFFFTTSRCEPAPSSRLGRGGGGGGHQATKKYMDPKVQSPFIAQLEKKQALP